MNKKLYINREFIKHLEELGEGRINWEVWERVGEQTRKQIEDILSSKQTVSKPKIEIFKSIQVFAYNGNGELVQVYNNHKECADKLGANKQTICKYSKNNHIYNDFLLSRENLKQDVAFALYRYALENNKIYKSNLATHKKSKYVYIYDKEGKMNGVYHDLLQFCRLTNTSNPSEIRKRLLESDIIINDRLVSFSYYDTTTALSIFTSLLKNC